MLEVVTQLRTEREVAVAVEVIDRAYLYLIRQSSVVTIAEILRTEEW